MPTIQPHSEFSKRVNAILKEKKLSQRELSEKADVKKRALDMYMGYQMSMPPADVACRIARVLGTSVEWLVMGE